MTESTDGFQGRAAQERGEELFRVHYAAVLASVRRRAPAERVDDVVAETFLVARRRLERVPVEEPLPWLLGVARNVLATHRRSSGRRSGLAVRLLSRWTELGGRRSQSDDWFAEQLPGGPVTAALESLREKDREAVVLIAWAGHTRELGNPAEMGAERDALKQEITQSTRERSIARRELAEREPPLLSREHDVGFVIDL